MQKVTPGERIAKVMARSGLCSRRQAELLIAEGRVTVDGQIITSAALNVTPTHNITVDGKLIGAREAVRLWRYHKPVGLVTTHRDPQGRPTVFDHLPPELGRVISVGRLDLATEGLLLLTNDGELADRLSHPSTNLKRTYRVRVFGPVTMADLARLKQGISVRDKDGKMMHYGSIEASLEPGKGRNNHWMTMTISEGKNREIRNICAELGLQVNRLIRLHYGPFSLGDLEDGEVAEVPKTEFASFLSSCQLPVISYQ